MGPVPPFFFALRQKDSQENQIAAIRAIGKFTKNSKCILQNNT